MSLKMPKPLSDGQVTYDDGAPQTVDQYSRDVSAFLMWAAEPHLEARKQTGFAVLVFLVLFGALVYLTKRKVWAGVPHEVRPAKLKIVGRRSAPFVFHPDGKPVSTVPGFALLPGYRSP